jgi:hypothetical protein
VIGLVACCKTKLDQRARAEDLYRSPLFRKARAYCLAHYPRWFILSAKYGLVDPGQVIAPYDCTLLKQGRKARAEWGQLVCSQLAALGLAGEAFAAHAGKVYVAPLAGRLRIETPLAGLGIGQQMAWYGQHAPGATTKKGCQETLAAPRTAGSGPAFRRHQAAFRRIGQAPCP